MSEGMRAYLTNKVLSLASVVAIIVGSFWHFGYIETQWQFVMIVLMTMAYSHYVIGMLYQMKSFLRKEKPWQYFLAFGVLVLFSLALTYVFFQIHLFFALLLLLFYFLIHGLLNEQTLLFRQTGINIPPSFTWPFFVIVIAMLAYAVPDHTFLMSRDLNFMPDNEFILITMLNSAGLTIEMFTRVFWVSVVISFILLFWAWYRSRLHASTISLGVTLVALILATYFFGPLPYVYMLFIVVGYHFVTWFLFYFSVFQKRSKRELNNFLLIHALFIAPFVVGGWLFFSPEPPAWSVYLFDYYAFTFGTYIHITTSFMNDQWFQKLQARVFGS